MKYFVLSILTIVILMTGCSERNQHDQECNLLKDKHEQLIKEQAILSDELKLKKLEVETLKIDLEATKGNLEKSMNESDEYLTELHELKESNRQLEEAMDIANEHMSFGVNSVKHDNPFKKEDIKLLDTVNGLILVDKYEYIAANYHSVKGLAFSGAIVVSGKYYHEFDSEYFSDSITFEPDEESAKLFPKAIGDDRYLWMTLADYDVISHYFGEQGEYGYVEMIIDYYFIDLEITETSNFAYVVEILDKEVLGKDELED